MIRRLAVACIGAGLMTVLMAQPAVNFRTHPLPNPGSSPLMITQGPDGNMWFTESLGDRVGRIDRYGTITEVSVAPNSYPWGIAGGMATSNQIFFTELWSSRVASMTTYGMWPRETPTPTPGAGAHAIAASYNWDAWFCESQVPAIGHIDAAGEITEYPLPPNNYAHGIALGPDFAMWFTLSDVGRVGRINTSGEISYVDLPQPTTPFGIATGPDGAVWYTDLAYNYIGRISRTGEVTRYKVPTPGAYPNQIARGPDQAMWFTEQNSALIGRIDMDGSITEYPLPPNIGMPQGIALGPDGTLWVCPSSGNALVQVFLGPVRPVSRVSPLPATTESFSFKVEWAAIPGGPAVQDFTIYVSNNGSPYTAWLTNTTLTSAVYSGQPGHHYSFYSIARDEAGTLESPKKGGETSTYIIDKTPPIVRPHITGVLGANGWYRSAVTVYFTTVDSDSGIDNRSPGCDGQEFTRDTPGVTVQCTAWNSQGLSTTESVVIRIDRVPPAISGMPEACILWPPNGEMTAVATIAAADATSGLAQGGLQVSAVSSEPAKTGDSDIAIVPDSGAYIVSLRAARQGGGNGRQYLISATATDIAGNAAQAASQCVVPRDQGRSRLTLTPRRAPGDVRLGSRQR